MIDFTKAAQQAEQMAQALSNGAGRKTLVNLSVYALSAEVLASVEKAQGRSIVEIRFPAEFDLAKPLRPQVAALIHKVECRLRVMNATSLDYIVLPDLPAAAYLLAEAFTRADAQAGPGIVWIKRVEGVSVLGGVE